MAAVAPHELVANKPIRSLRLEESSVSSASETSHSVVSRRDTEQILDYYQSEDAGRVYVDPKNAISQDRHIQSDRDRTSRIVRSMLRPRSAGGDANANVGRTSMESVDSSASGGVQRRTSQRSSRGAEKRRIAIVEMDPQYEMQKSSLQSQSIRTTDPSYIVPQDHGLLARRGVDSSRLGNLAFIGPPDAHISAHTGISSVPTSAPATGVPPMDRPTKPSIHSSGHQRSMSDIQSRKRTGGSKASPRDVGIVGTLETMQTTILPTAVQTVSPLSDVSEYVKQSISDHDRGNHGHLRDHSLTAPVFQTPRSRSPSPLPGADERPLKKAMEASLMTTSWTVGSGLQTSRDIDQEAELIPPIVTSVTSEVITRRHSPNTIPSGLPVTEPSIMGLNPYEDHNVQHSSGRLSFKQNQAGPTYLHYQPGVHSTAGPLPSPPRHIPTQPNASPPPRPPRLLSPLPTTLKNDTEHLTKSNKSFYTGGSREPIISERSLLPISRGDSDFSIAAISVSSSGSEDRSHRTSPKPPEENRPIRKQSGPSDVHEKNSTISSRSSSHVREGAFPASSVFLSKSSQLAPLNKSQPDKIVAAVDETTENADFSRTNSMLPKVEPLQVLKRSRARSSLKRKESSASVSAESVGGGPDETSPPSSYSSHEGSTHVSTTNIESDDRQLERRRASLPVPPLDAQDHPHLLPRTPSLSFMRGEPQTFSSSFPKFPKKPPSSWPEAMNFHQVLKMKSAAERALAYAEKIQELAGEDTGLRDWLLPDARKERRGTQAAASMAPSSQQRSFVKHPRHVSRGSMASEVTFPIRADSYTATDLSLRPTLDTSLNNSSPSLLPYPSLAHGVGIRSHPTHNSTQIDPSNRGMTLPGGSSKTLGGAFFLSLGRKNSLRKDRALGSTSSAKLISSRQAAPIPQPRPVKIAGPPTIPGGPRAPARRTNSFMSAAGPVEKSRSEPQDSSVPPRQAGYSTEAFNIEVEKLSDLLPHADKDVLASYLRRANNQDPMLAIGTYLEDEKQGSLSNKV